MEKYLIIILIAISIGFSAGVVAYSISVGANSADNTSQNNKFCQQVEQGIQEEMEKGFANCFKPSAGYFGLREDIRNSTSISCMCRKKVNGVIQQVKIAEPN